MQVHSSRFCTSRIKGPNSGQALIWILLLLGLSALTVSTLSKVALWKLDSTVALMNQRKQIENWESERSRLVKLAYPTLSYKRVNLGNNQLATPVLTNKTKSLDSLRIPVFRVADSNTPLFNWRRFLKEEIGSCLKVESGKCTEIILKENRAIVWNNLFIDTLEVQSGLTTIVATGEISIGSLKLLPGANAEIFSASNLRIGKLLGGKDSNLFLASAQGRIDLTTTDSTDCQSVPKVKLSSKQAIHFKNNLLVSTGCTNVQLSPFWQNLIYLGDLPQKSLK